MLGGHGSELFRKKPKPEAVAIDDFWHRWAAVRDDLARTLGAGGATRPVEEITRRARAIVADLDCHVVPGHHFGVRAA